MNTTAEPLVEGVAIIAAAGRFPGAPDVVQFWANLCAGIESVSVLTDAQLAESGFDPRQLRADPRYVPVRGVVERAEWFDAAFFGFTPREAQLTDPQHRLFLEAAWEALETAGCDPARSRGTVGVFAGCGNNTWARRYFARDLDELESGEWLESAIGNEKDYVATRVAYKLNLRGPAVNVNTACSTSLVAVCQACQALWTYQCDVALAGGVNVSFPQARGYYHDDDGISSPDGHTRAFDADARGTVFSNGLGVVVLKRLADALENGDEVLAVIRGAAVNNDGGGKASFTAPSAEGQAEVIALAYAMAGLSPDTVSYVETHGTATPIGDVIELAGLTQAFRLGSTRTQYCAIGSVKSNIGHVEHAAGVAGLIKTALALHHCKIPPSLHYRRPNPKLELSSSPFFVNESLREWSATDSPRRAGVSSFGVGGTNAHVVLEEAPLRPPSGPSGVWHLLPLSAKTEVALDGSSRALADSLRRHSETALADVAFTLQRGRSAFDCRRAVVARCATDVVAALSGAQPEKVVGPERATDRQVVFMFPGGGAQYAGAARGLCEQLPEFKQHIDTCLGTLDPQIAAAVTHLMRLAPHEVTDADRALAERPSVGLPMLFAIEFATAQYWLARGVTPGALIGHSLGEYAAACVAGVMSVADAVALVQSRGRLFDELPAGAMLSVAGTVHRVIPYLDSGLELAVINGPASCVVSGPTDRIGQLAERLDSDGLNAVRLHIAVAAHSSLVEPILPAFRSFVTGLRLQAPRLPIVSNVTGTWLREAEAVNPDYWVEHLRRTVRFSEGLQSIFRQSDSVFLEVGPGRVLSTIVRGHPDRPLSTIAVESIRHPQDGRDDYEVLLTAQARLWVGGTGVDWDQEYRDQVRRRVALPTYPFDRKAFLPKLASTHPGKAVQVKSTKSIDAFTASPATQPPRPAPVSSVDRAGEITRTLGGLIEGLTGIASESLAAEATFIELGFDSLLLTQLAQAIQRRFGIRFKFRRFFEDLSSIRAVVASLDAQLPADAFAPPPPTPGAPTDGALLTALTGVVPSPRSGDDPLIERVIREQLTLMGQQLAMLRGRSGASAARGLASESAVPLAESSTLEPASEAASRTAARPSQSTALGAVASIGRTSMPELTADQRRYLADLTRRYTQRTPTSKKLTQQYRRPHADPRTASGFTRLWKELVYPIVVSRSSGARLWDVDDNEYIDLLCGFGPTFLGHSHPVVTEAVSAQLARGFELGPQTLLAGEAAALFCELTGQERVSFVNTGSEAVQAALRIARTVTGRSKVATFSRDYHGNFDEMLVRGLWTRGAPATVPSAPGIPQRAVDDVIVLEYGSTESLAFLEQCANDLAAIVVEPVQSRRPEFQPREFLHQLRRLTAKSESLLIFDEVVTGLRIGPGGAQAHFGVIADLATYGKVLGGGLPIGAVAGRAEFMDTFDGGQWAYGDDSVPVKPVTFFAGTFARHPLAIAAAHATLSFLKSSGSSLWDGLNARCGRLATAIEGICRREGIPVSLPHFCSLMYPRIEEGNGLANLLFYELRARGIYLHEPYPCYLNLAHTDADVDRVVEVFEAAVSCLQASGVFQYSPQAVPVAVGPPEKIHEVELPLTPGQLEIWLAARISTAANCAYNEIAAIELNGALNVAALEGAVRQLAARHDGLRTRVHADGRAQVIAEHCDCQVVHDDLSAVPDGDHARRFDEILSYEQHQPFDLEHGPLFRTRLVRIGPERHIFLFNGHHLVCDGWSAGVILKDLAAFYSAAVDARCHAPGRAPQFREYVAGLDAASAEREEAQRYWLERFREPAPVLDLPADAIRPRLRTYSASRASVQLTAAEVKVLKSAAVAHKTTQFALLLAVYGVMLHRLTGQDDVVIGIAAAGQSEADAPELVGHCVSLLPHRSRIGRDLKTLDYLGQVRRSLFDAFEHQSVTFGSLVAALNVPRDPNRVPLVSAVVTHETDTPGIDFAGLVSTHQFMPRAFCIFDLELYLRETTDGGLLIEFYGNADILQDATVARLLDSFRSVLDAVIAKPEGPIGAVPVVSARERALLADWGETRAEYPREATIPQVFAAVVARTPDAVAVSCGGETLTYAALDTQSSRVAAMLRRAGVRRGDLVGVCLERGLAPIVAQLAVLKAGAAYLPVDTSYPTARIAFILADAQVRVVLAEQRTVGVLSPSPATVLRMDEFTGGPGLEERSQVGTSEDLAYVMYTSGSTGQPNGVRIPHRGVLRLVLGTTYVDWRQATTFLQMAPLAFDAATFEVWGALLHGAPLEVFPDRVPTLPRLEQVLHSAQVNCLWLTAAFFNFVVDERPECLAGVRQLIVGGEALSVPHVLRAQTHLPFTQLINGYGPTECTTFACCYSIPPLKPEVTSVPIGRPIANTQVVVLDAHRQPVPVGVVGELFIGGDGVALGYHERPELTAGRFVVDPTGASAARWYRTGDLVRWVPSGVLEFVGRVDEQIKLRGFRVEPGEIEAVCRRHPAVGDVAVLLHKRTATDARLVAYVVQVAGAAATTAEVRQFLEQQVPPHLVPSEIVWVDALPLTANGKVDRAALQARSSGLSVVSSPVTQTASVPPTPTEQTLLNIWRELLQVETVKVDADFFALGGHSLLAVRMVSAIHDAFGRSLPFTALVQYPTVAKLATLLDPPATPDARTSSLVALQRSGTRPPLFLLPGIGSEVWTFLELSKELGDDQPVFGLLPIDTAAGTIDEMAAGYAAEIEAAYPDGPYILGGYCSGAVTAFEVAQQLRLRGKPVRMVVVFDYWSEERRCSIVDYARNVAFWFFDDFMRTNVSNNIGRVRSRMRLLWARLRQLTGSPNRLPDVRDVLGMWRYPDHEVQRLQDFHEALLAYRFTCYAGPIHVFRARTRGLSRLHPSTDMGWGKIADGPLTIETVPGSHDSMFAQPFVRTLAIRLDRVIRDAAEADQASTPMAVRAAVRQLA